MCPRQAPPDDWRGADTALLLHVLSVDATSGQPTASGSCWRAWRARLLRCWRIVEVFELWGKSGVGFSWLDRALGMGALQAAGCRLQLKLVCSLTGAHTHTINKQHVCVHPQGEVVSTQRYTPAHNTSTQEGVDCV